MANRLRSMTAYGRSSVVTPLGQFVVEIQSINKRHFEMQCQLPQSLARFEAKIRGRVGALVHRGQLLYRLRVTYGDHAPVQLDINRPLLKQLKSAWEQIAIQLGHAKHTPLPLELFATRTDLLLQEDAFVDDEALWQGIHTATEQALAQFIEVKQQEGDALVAAIQVCQKRLAEHMLQVETLLPEAIAKYRQRLRDKLAAFVSEASLDDERMLREVCLFAEKADVAEELARLQSHLSQLSTLLGQETISIGKQLEFLLQEIGREINTLGAKCSDIAVIQLTLAMKGEVEKIREQVQNIE